MMITLVGRAPEVSRKSRKFPIKRVISHEGEYDVFFDGNLIGFINTKKEFSNWEDKTKPYCISYVGESYNEYDDNRMSYCSTRFKTLFAAKQGVFKEWKESGSIIPKCKKQSPKCNVAELPSGDSSDFYPTPTHIAGLMLSMVDLRYVSTVLEPSAGKGDLCDALKSMYGGNRSTRGYFEERIELDCIEIDQNLRFILQGKGYRVIHDDFLTLNTKKKYDLILANPPFSEADEHIMKMLDMQEDGGQLVCLLNAETLRNPYTNLRKTLLKRLDEYGATIKFVRDGFTKSQRKTGVEIAVVSVKIPVKSFVSSNIWDNMKKAAEQKDEESSEPTQLATGNYIEQLIKSCELEINASLAFFKEYNGFTPYILNNNNSEYAHPLFQLSICDHKYESIGREATNRYLRAVRRKYWEALFHLPQLTEKFTSNIMQSYQDSIDKMQDYDFTMFNIQQILVELNSKLQLGVHESIMQLFETFTAKHSWNSEIENGNIHYYSGWASNKAHKINSKVIIPIYGCFASSWRSEKLDEYACVKLLSDMEKSLDYLDRGKTENVDLLGCIHRANAVAQTRNINCKYFSITFYKKGTCHIKFHDQRIVDILNIYAAQNKNWLPPCYGRKKYEDLTPDEKAVIDDFQTESEYREVCANTNEYLLPMGAGQLALPA